MTPRCLDTVHLTDAELDCLIASDACHCPPAADCLGRVVPGAAPTRGAICNLIVSLRRRWRRWNARDLSREPYYMALWLRACFRRLYNLDAPSDDQIEGVIDDALRYHEFLNHQSKGVRRVFCRIPYVVGGTQNSAPVPELEQALEEQRRARFNVWNDEFDRGESQHMGPFSQLKFTMDLDLLKSCPRELCPSCSKKVYLYCTDCHCWAISSLKSPPRLTLPINVITVAKKKEWAKKCTAVHSCVVAPDNCSLVEFPSQMNTINGLDRESTMILYPNDTALDMESAEALPKLKALKNLIVVDSTCAGARQIMSDHRLQGLPSVALKSRHTTFWKFTHHGPAFLGTIEAIYYFLVDYFEKTHDQLYDGRYDDLMLLYVHQLRRVESSVVKSPLAWKND